MISLKEVLKYLKDNKFVLLNRIDFDNFYFEIGEKIVSITSPHSGNDYSYLLRADFKKDFDRWSNCEFETIFTNKEEMLVAINDLNNFR